MLENKNTEKLNFFTITKKYWKEQLILYFLGTISFLFGFVIKQNGLTAIHKIIKTGKNESLKFTIFWKKIHTFPTWQAFAWLMAGIITIYFLIVMAHVYYRHYLSNKIVYDVKQRITSKFLKSSNEKGNEKETLNMLTYGTRNFADMVVFAPNQIFLIILGAIFTFIGLNRAEDNVLWWGISYFAVVVIVCLTINYFLYQKDLLFQKKLVQQTKKENALINHRDLIIKKGLFFSWQKEYQPIVDETRKAANQSDFFYTSAFVVPSYFLIPLAQLIFLPFMNSDESFVALEMLLRLFDELKKMIERLWNYPYYFSAKKRLNKFLSQKERDDLQNNLLIKETIETIEFQGVNFAYQSNHLILQKTNLQFQKGQLNHLTGANGFGKSTIINLVTGLYKPQAGKIVINNRYSLSDLNLHAWREKIAYAEHDNLVEENLSTGQKQLADLNNLFANSQNKQIFIFDEASNSLDEKNRQSFQQKLAELIKSGKLVILVGH